jgi:PAS domain S-box-containing protein
VYLLGLLVLLVIAFRRLRAQQTPLNDQLYRTTVAFENVPSGVAWVRADGTVRSINQSLAVTLGWAPKELIGRGWYELFAKQDGSKLEEAFGRMLLIGKATLEVHRRQNEGADPVRELMIVAIRDKKERFMGHYCLIAATRVREFEAQIDAFTKNLEIPIAVTKTNTIAIRRIGVPALCNAPLQKHRGPAKLTAISKT